MFLVVTNNYRASGGGHFPGCDGSTIVLEAPDANREALMRYIVETQACRAEGRRQLAVRAMAGERRRRPSVTSPAAADVAPPAGVKADADGRRAGGFLKYRIEPV